MGQEVVYCFKCGTRLKGADFEKGTAFKIGDKTCCATCAVGLLTSLPAEEQQAILAKVMNSESTKKLVVQGEVIESNTGVKTPTPGPRPAEGTSKTKLVTPKIMRAPMGTQRSAAASKEKGVNPVWVFAGVGMVLAGVLGAFLAFGGPRPSTPVRNPVIAHAPDSADSSLATSPPAISPSPAEKSGGRTPVTAGPQREDAAKLALDKARDYAKANPEDLSGQIKAYTQAMWDAEKTSHFETIQKELQPLVDRQRAEFDKEFGAVQDRVTTACDKEQFKSALDALADARKAHSEIDWTMRVDKKVQAVIGGIEQLFAQLKEKALAARKSANEKDLKSIRERVGQWGLDTYPAELQKTLSEAAEPATESKLPGGNNPPKAEDEPAAYKAAWDKAMALCSGRMYSPALQELERASNAIQDATLRSESQADLESIRSVRALYYETRQLLAEWPDGRKISLKYTDETGTKKSVNDPVVQANLQRMELRKGKSSIMVEYTDIDVESLLPFVKARKKFAKSDGRTIALFALFEGDTELAKANLGEPVSVIAQKFWDYARKLAEARAKAPKQDAEAVKKEHEARETLYAADREFKSLSTRLNAVDKYKSLLNNFAETAFVKHNEGYIKRRSDGDRDYVFFASDLKAAGTFKLGKQKDVDQCWTSDSDSDPNKRQANYVEAEFYAVAGAQYHVYIFMGGCCQETLSFFFQANELVGMNGQQQLSCEPGSNAFLSVPARNGNWPANHAAHGGTKSPTIWGWGVLNCPNFATPGIKKIRILTDQQGFSVGAVVITATRNAPPTPQELRQLEHEH